MLLGLEVPDKSRKQFPFFLDFKCYDFFYVIAQKYDPYFIICIIMYYYAYIVCVCAEYR